MVQVCFTGLARFGSEKTRNWISEILATTSHPIDIDRVASEIAMRGTPFVKRAPPNVKALTVLIAAAKVDQNLRLILVSNIYRLGDRRLATPLDSLEVDSVTPSRPALFVHGYDVGVSQNDRKFLKSLLRRDSHSKSVMDGLSAVNVRTAQNRASNGRISEGCMASLLLADGIHTSFNYGGVKGIPDTFEGGFDLGKEFRKFLPKHAVIRQTTSSNFKGAPQRLPEGEPRTFQYSNPRG